MGLGIFTCVREQVLEYSLVCVEIGLRKGGKVRCRKISGITNSPGLAMQRNQTFRLKENKAR